MRALVLGFRAAFTPRDTPITSWILWSGSSPACRPKRRTQLQQLACLGNIAEIATLSIVLGISEEQVHAALWPAVRQELVERLAGAYRFVHDRVQEAAYSLIPEELRSEAHLRIGRQLAAHVPPEKREEAIFDIVNQLNRGAALIASQTSASGWPSSI